MERKAEDLNNSRGSVGGNLLRAVAGLFLLALGMYVTIQANIGVSPWDALNLGLSGTFGVIYGTASIAVSLLVLGVDLLLREPIGLGMLLDAVLIGKFVDLFNWLDLVPLQEDPLLGVLLMTGGFVLMGAAQVLYMGAGLGCGPRDSLLVGLGKRLRPVPIGAVCVLIMAVAAFFGWLLGGPIGVGTLYSTFATGPVTQGMYRLFRFDPTAVTHQDLLTSLGLLLGRKR